MNCPSCQGEVLEIDVKCSHCGAALGATGAHRMIGNVVLSQYELVDVLGQGGMSVVFKGRHAMTGQEVALKILPPELAAHSQVKSRFLEEAKALAALDHPNIVHLYNFGQENGSFVLAMQFVQGRTWERLILESKRLDWKISCRIAIDVLKALEYAHGRGVVHRDMKPSNVLVRESDGAATVMDFGIAKMTTSTKLTATGQTMGTVRYMSPEQVRGQEVDLRTDIYSLGATLYESLVGDTPFDGTTHFEIMTKHLSEVPRPPSAHGVELPKVVEEAILKSLAKKPQDRFETARDMRKLLEAALKEGDVGLFETQRLQRELLGDVKASASSSKPTKDERKASLGLAETTRSATANDLADQLEPGTVSPRKVTKGGQRKWIVLMVALLVLGGGGITAALLLKQAGAPGYRAKNRLEGVTFKAGKTFPGGLFVETDGAVTPDEVAERYTAALQALHAFEPQIDAERDVVGEVVAVPQAALCSPSIVRASRGGCRPGDTFAVALRGKTKGRLLVASDRDVLATTMRAGLAQAVCDLQVLFLSGTDEETIHRLEEICAMTKRFAETR